MLRRSIVLRNCIVDYIQVVLEFCSCRDELKTSKEFLNFAQKKQLKRICVGLLEDTLQICDHAFPVLNQHKIQLELKYCIFLYEILGEKEGARKRIKVLFMDSLKDLNR